MGTLQWKQNMKITRCKFFVVPRNGQALLGMPDIDVLNIIKVNIHSIGTEQTGGSDNCCANRPAAQKEDMKQERNRADRCYMNTDSISKSKIKICQWLKTKYLVQ